MLALVLGAIVTTEDGSLALIWDGTPGTILALPVVLLRRPRHRADVLLTERQVDTFLGFHPKAPVIVDTRRRVVVDPLTTHCHGIIADDELIETIRLTERREREATYLEQRHFIAG